MKKKKVLALLFVFLIVIIGAAMYGYYLFNRTNESLVDINPAFTSSPDELIEEFSKDINNASKKYIDKVIQVKGTVKKIESVKEGDATIIFGNENSLSSLRFSIDSTEVGKVKNIKVNSIISLKGMCTGYNGDDMGLGSDVLFNRTVIVETKK